MQEILSMEGYWYHHPDKMPAVIRQGTQIKRQTPEPPWLIVQQSLHSVAIGSGQWPGELWCARVIGLGDMSGLVAQPGYWRATSIDLLEQLPLSALFGPHGSAIVALLTQIESLSLEQVERLASFSNPEANAAYTRAWKHWARAGNSSHSAIHSEDLGCLLYLPDRNKKPGSPINHGFMLLYNVIWERARFLEGDRAFVITPDGPNEGDGEPTLAPVWQKANATFLHAAMAMGAPEHVPESDYSLLVRAWGTVFNIPGKQPG